MTSANAHVVLVDNFYYSRRGPRVQVDFSPHLGLMSLAALLEQAGCEVEIFDPKRLFVEGDHERPDSDFLAAWALALADRNADIIGFTAYGRTLPFVVGSAERLKGLRPDSTIIIGGPHATILGPRLLELFTCFDLVVRYEAEPIIAELVGRLRVGADVSDLPNLVFRSGERLVQTATAQNLVEMDDLPPPALHLYPRAQVEQSELSIEAGRGCPFACTFCSTANFFRRRYRMKSNARMIEEMESARADYGVPVFNLNHDLFGLNKRTLRTFCELVEGRGFEWKCSMRPDTLGPDLLDRLVAAGCSHIYFGVETGSTRLQTTIRKHLDLQTTRDIVRRVVEVGMKCTVSFITGFPDESREDLAATLDLLGDLVALAPGLVQPQLHVLSPEPGSALGDSAAAIHFDGLGPEADDLCDAKLIADHPEVFSVFYHFGTELPRWRIVLASAFITFIAPLLGAPLACHLIETFFGGRLSALVDAVAPEDPGPLLTYDDVCDTLWAGVESLCRRLGPEAPYLADLLQLSRIVAGLGEADDDARLILASFSVDLPPLIAFIINNSELRVPSELGAPGRFWYLVSFSPKGAPNIVPVSGASAQDLIVAADSIDFKKVQLQNVGREIQLLVHSSAR